MTGFYGGSSNDGGVSGGTGYSGGTKSYEFRGGVSATGTSKFDAAKNGFSQQPTGEFFRGVLTGDQSFWDEQAALAYQEEKSLNADDEAKYGSGSKYAGIYKKPEGSPASGAGSSGIAAEAQNLAKAEEEIKKRTGTADKSGGAARVDTGDTALSKTTLLGV